MVIVFLEFDMLGVMVKSVCESVVIVWVVLVVFFLFFLVRCCSRLIGEFVCVF